MASCIFTSGISAGACAYSVGGINNIWLMNKSEIAAYTQNVGSGVTDILMSETVVPGTFNVAYVYEFSEGTGLASTEMVESNGQKYFTHTIGLSIPSQTQANIMTIEALGLANVVAIVESKIANTGNFATENKFYVFGLKNGLSMRTNTSGFGQAEGDYAGFVITLSKSATEMHREIQLTYGAAYIAPTLSPLAAGTYPSYASWIARLLDDTDL